MVETIALQEIDTIVVPFVTLAHAHIGGNHDVSFTIMHTGDVGITGSAFNAGVLFWIEDTGNPASGRVMEKCGFSDTGMLNQCSQLVGGDKDMVKVFKYKGLK